MKNKEISFWQDIKKDVNEVWKKRKKWLLIVCLPLAIIIIFQEIHEKWEFYNWLRHFCNIVCIFGILFCLFGLYETFKGKLEEKKQ